MLCSAWAASADTHLFHCTGTAALRVSVARPARLLLVPVLALALQHQVPLQGQAAPLTLLQALRTAAGRLLQWNAWQ